MEQKGRMESMSPLKVEEDPPLRPGFIHDVPVVCVGWTSVLVRDVNSFVHPGAEVGVARGVVAGYGA